MNKKVRKSFSSTFKTKGMSVLLLFSFIVTILAFAVAYNEHQKIVILSQKYDEAIVKINDCEAVLDAIIKQIENTSSAEVTKEVLTEESTVPIETTIPTETTISYQEQITTNTANNTSVTRSETTSPSPETTKNITEKATTAPKTPSTSGSYFVTQSGKKYHVSSCSYLSKSKIAITMDRIKADGYSPCSRCIK